MELKKRKEEKIIKPMYSVVTTPNGLEFDEA